MSNKIKAAVIGIGNMGKNHVRTYFEIEDIDLVAVADLNETLGTEMAEQFKAQYYKDYKDMLTSIKPDMVSVCVPTAYHFDVAKDVIDAGVSLLLEKPITMQVAEGEELLKSAKKRGVKILVGHIERFNPAIKKVKEMIDKGELGEITSIMARRVGGFPPQIKDANIAVDLAIHDIDIVNYLLGDLPKEVIVAKRSSHIKKREDSVEIFMKYKCASAYVQANWITPVKIRKLNITGTEGYLEMDYINQKIEFYKSNYDKFIQEIGDFSDYILRFSDPDRIDINVAKKEPLREEISYLADCIRKDREIDCRYAVEALKIAQS